MRLQRFILAFTLALTSTTSFAHPADPHIEKEFSSKPPKKTWGQTASDAWEATRSYATDNPITTFATTVLTLLAGKLAIDHLFPGKPTVAPPGGSTGGFKTPSRHTKRTTSSFDDSAKGPDSERSGDVTPRDNNRDSDDGATPAAANQRESTKSPEATEHHSGDGRTSSPAGSPRHRRQESGVDGLFGSGLPVDVTGVFGGGGSLGGGFRFIPRGQAVTLESLLSRQLAQAATASRQGLEPVAEAEVEANAATTHDSPFSAGSDSNGLRQQDGGAFSGSDDDTAAHDDTAEHSDRERSGSVIIHPDAEDTGDDTGDGRASSHDEGAAAGSNVAHTRDSDEESVDAGDEADNSGDAFEPRFTTQTTRRQRSDTIVDESESAALPAGEALPPHAQTMVVRRADLSGAPPRTLVLNARGAAGTPVLIPEQILQALRARGVRIDDSWTARLGLGRSGASSHLQLMLQRSERESLRLILRQHPELLASLVQMGILTLPHTMLQNTASPASADARVEVLPDDGESAPPTTTPPSDADATSVPQAAAQPASATSSWGTQVQNEGISATDDDAEAAAR